MSAVWADPPSSLYLVGKRPPLSQYRWFYRWLARWLYQQMHWCPEWGIELQGVFTDEAEARFRASAPGMFYMALPLNAELPAEPCAYGRHDFPYSEASPWYRHRRMPFTAVETSQLEHLHKTIH